MIYRLDTAFKELTSPLNMCGAIDMSAVKIHNLPHD